MMYFMQRVILLSLLTGVLSSMSYALDVSIAPGLESIEVPHANKMIKVQRNQDNKAVIQGDFAKTSRNCPPFCIQPIEAGEGVKTIGTLELIYFMSNHLKHKSGVLIDARTPKWFNKGTIPGSINIPYTHLKVSAGADEFLIEDALILLGAEKDAEQWDFFDAKELVLWCNGPWCGQSPEAIRGLLELGYPAEKIRYFRGGMQAWQMLGFNIIKPGM